MNKSMKQFSLILLLVLLGFLIFNFYESLNQKPMDIQYSDFIKKVEDNKVSNVTIRDNKIIEGYFFEGDKKSKFETVIPYHDPNLIAMLKSKKEINFEGAKEDKSVILNLFLQMLPWLLILGIIWFVMVRQVQSTGSKAMSFGKSKAKLHPETSKKVTFKDVAGVDEAKEEVTEIIDFLKDPKKFNNIGAKIPKGVLLVGSPGTGKTLLARAIAGEAGVPFFSISGSDFVEMFVGVGASRVRDLFEQGKRSAPCIVFIDEIDAVGRLRGAGLGGGHDEREQTLNQLLVEMDGFETNEGVIIIAATNRPDVLDPALLRPGRFDRQVIVNAPDVKGREQILAVHSKKIPLEKQVNLKTIAKGTPGFTGADLANLINEGALLAARKDKKRVSMEDMEHAKDKILMGPERKSLMLTEDEKEKTAYHEAGHAIIIATQPEHHSLHKVTIVPRGRALGYAEPLPKEEKHSHQKSYFIDLITTAYGGYVAEKIKYNETTTGVSNDLERATNMAKTMVCKWGMSDKIGAIKMGTENGQVFLGKEISHSPDYSEETAKVIDSEIKLILDECLDRATKIITENIDKFEKIANYLIERETLDASEIDLIMQGEELPPVEENEPAESVTEEAGKTDSEETKTNS